MIKAKYIGVDNDLLQHGKVYEIKTHCIKWEGKSKLEVCFGERFRYRVLFDSLEKFLKFWRIVGVYHG